MILNCRMDDKTKSILKLEISKDKCIILIQIKWCDQSPLCDIPYNTLKLLEAS